MADYRSFIEGMADAMKDNLVVCLNEVADETIKEQRARRIMTDFKAVTIAGQTINGEYGCPQGQTCVDGVCSIGNFPNVFPFPPNAG